MPISIRASAVSWCNVSSVLLMGLAAHGCTGAIEGQDQEQRRPPFGANAAEATGSRAPGSQPDPPQAALPPASLPPAQMPPFAVTPGRPVDPPQSRVPSCPAGGLVNPAGRTQRLEPAQLNETFRLFGYSVSSALPNPGIVDHLQDSETSYRVDEIEAIDRVASMPLPSFETRYTKRLTDCSASADALACLAKTWSQVASDLWGIAPLDNGADAAPL